MNDSSTLIDEINVASNESLAEQSAAGSGVSLLSELPPDDLLNCWEVKKCGREGGGSKAAEPGVCPAYPDHGHCCAEVTGTLCGGKVQGEFARKLTNCQECEFYRSENYLGSA